MHIRFLIAPLIIASVASVLAFIFGGTHALFLVALLAVLETTLSFDNAVVNARVLERMDVIWRRRFMTWGIAVAVFGTRVVLPILIVAAAVGMSPFSIAALAISDPVAYGEQVASAHVVIAAFGSAFLMLVALKFFIDENKRTHWIRRIERFLSRWGGVEAIEVACVLASLLVASCFAPHEAFPVLAAGIVGVILFILIEGVAQIFEVEGASVGGGLALFAYLNVLDSAFSLDGVVGAFAVTSSLLIIVAGLGVGALFVRSFTLAMVEARTLAHLPYLEHGAHWAILGLSFAMLASIFVDVPEIVTGLVGLVFIGFSYWSSRRTSRAGMKTAR